MKTTSMKRHVIGLALLVVGGCATFPDVQQTRQIAEQMVKTSFTAPTPQLLKRLEQDRAQQLCSRIDKAPLTPDEAAEVVKVSRESIKTPKSGVLVGDWKVGAKLAYDGAGDRIQGGKLEKRKENGGLCQNCHGLERGEINVGNIGPPLTGYGAQRGNSDAIAKYTYEKIYNAWVYLPCSNMPRLGTTGHLTPEQIAHMVAYLIDPQSSLNRP